MPTLLRLPPPPPLASPQTLTSLYRTPISQTLTTLPASTKTLYIAVPAPFSTAHRRETFAAADRLFAALYSLVHDLSAHVDIRILLTGDVPGGPVVTEESLTSHPWTSVLSPSVTPVEVHAVPYPDSPGPTQEHTRVAVGGTFDHLHTGHKLLLTLTAYLPAPAAERVYVVVGVSGAEMLREKAFAAFLEPWRVRVEGALAFIRGICGVGGGGEELREVEGGVVASVADGRWTVFFADLRDPCGPTITDPEISALVLTEETMKGGEFVNRMRRERGMRELDVVAVGLVMAGESTVGKLSSTELRRREAERVGRI